MCSESFRTTSIRLKVEGGSEGLDAGSESLDAEKGLPLVIVRITGVIGAI